MKKMKEEISLNDLNCFSLIKSQAAENAKLHQLFVFKSFIEPESMKYYAKLIKDLLEIDG